MSESISAKDTVPKKWVVESLSQIARQQDPLAKLQAMLDALLNFKKAKTVFHPFCARFMLQKLTSSQVTATDATKDNLEAFFNLRIDYRRLGLKPWKLQSERYEMPQRLSNNHIQYAVSVHKLTYRPLPMSRGQSQRLDKGVI